MLVDVTWLTQEAKNLHNIFQGLFYPLVTSFLLLGVVLDYFKFSLGQVPSFGVLVGRAVIAVFLLTSFTEVTNLLGSLTDQLATRLGDLNQIKHVLSKMGDKLETLTASWVSVKDAITLGISFVSFFVLYFSVFVAEAIMMFSWTILYVFSPILIAFFVLPATAGATKALYRSLIEVSLWKIVWSTLATLLWSMALTKLNQEGSDVNFVSVICLNLFLAGSLLATPWIVHSLAGAGLSSYAGTLGSIAVGAITISPTMLLKKAGMKFIKKDGLSSGPTHRGYNSRLKNNKKTKGKEGGE